VVTRSESGQIRRFFDHIGAVVYYLKVVAWAIPEYRLEAFMPRLRAAWETPGAWPWPSAQHRFLVTAAKPA